MRLRNLLRLPGAFVFLLAAVAMAAGADAPVEIPPAAAVPMVRLEVDRPMVPAGEPVSVTAVLSPPVRGATYWYSLADQTMLGGGTDVGTITTRFATAGRQEVRVTVLVEQRFLHAFAVVNVTSRVEALVVRNVPEPAQVSPALEQKAGRAAVPPAKPPAVAVESPPAKPPAAGSETPVASREVDLPPLVAARTPIAIGPAPAPILEVRPRDAEIGQLISFEAAYPTQGDSVRFRFTVGEETNAWQREPVFTHSFTREGRFTTHVEVGLADGDRIVPLATGESVNVEIHAPAPVNPPTLVAVPAAPEVGQIVNFAARFPVADGSTRYRYRFGAGAEPGPWAREPRTAHAFAAEGRVPVTVEVGRERGGEVRVLSASVPVVVDVLPQWRVSVALTGSAPQAGETATFAIQSNRTDYHPHFTVVFDDGLPAVETDSSAFSHLCLRTGPARVVVRAVAGPQHAEAEIGFAVAPAEPPNLRTEPPSGDVGQEIRFVATHPTRAVRYRFAFGDGASSGEWSPEPITAHRYATHGRFVGTVEVGLPGPDGVAVIARSVPIVVEIGPSLRIEVRLESKGVGAGRETLFRVSSNRPESEGPMTIDFGDGSARVPVTPGQVAHTFERAGEFRVSAQSTDPAQSARAELTVSVGNEPAGVGRVLLIVVSVVVSMGFLWSALRSEAAKPGSRS